MRIVTWNLGYWLHRHEHDRAWSYLRDVLQPDIALLQEARPPRLREDEHLVFRPVADVWGTALYSRKAVERELTVSGHPNRVAVAFLGLPSGEEIGAASVHAPIVGGRVFPYLDEIFQELEFLLGDSPFVVGGDLNSARLAERVWPGHGHGPFFDGLERSGFYDCYQKFHLAEVQTVFRPGAKHPLQDDHLFVSQSLIDLVASCHAQADEVTRRVSDHIPLIMEVSV